MNINININIEDDDLIGWAAQGGGRYSLWGQAKRWLLLGGRQLITFPFKLILRCFFRRALMNLRPTLTRSTGRLNTGGQAFLSNLTPFHSALESLSKHLVQKGPNRPKNGKPACLKNTLTLTTITIYHHHKVPEGERPADMLVHVEQAGHLVL